MRCSSSGMSCGSVASGPSLGQHFYGSGMPGGAGSHPAEPLGPGRMAAGKAEAGSEPQPGLGNQSRGGPQEGACPQALPGRCGPAQPPAWLSLTGPRP